MYLNYECLKWYFILYNPTNNKTQLKTKKNLSSRVIDRHNIKNTGTSKDEEANKRLFILNYQYGV